MIFTDFCQVQNSCSSSPCPPDHVCSSAGSGSYECQKTIFTKDGQVFVPCYMLSYETAQVGFDYLARWLFVCQLMTDFHSRLFWQTLLNTVGRSHSNQKQGRAGISRSAWSIYCIGSAMSWLWRKDVATFALIGCMLWWECKSISRVIVTPK